MQTLTDQIAATFRAHPGVLFSMQQLAAIGGTGGWRTRLSECRTRHGMTIENYQRRRRLENGRRITESYYRYVPAAPSADGVTL